MKILAFNSLIFLQLSQLNICVGYFAVFWFASYSHVASNEHLQYVRCKWG